MLSAAFCSLHLASIDHARLARYLPLRDDPLPRPFGAAAAASVNAAGERHGLVDQRGAGAANVQDDQTVPHHWHAMLVRLIDDSLLVVTRLSHSTPAAISALLGAQRQPQQQTRHRCKPHAGSRGAIAFDKDKHGISFATTSFGSIVNQSKVRIYVGPLAPPQTPQTPAHPVCMPTAVATPLPLRAAVEACSSASNIVDAATSSEFSFSDMAGPIGAHSQHLADGKERHLFPWCGWLIDTTTCELHAHLSRARVAHARDRGRRCGGHSLGKILSLLCRVVRPKLHCALVDPQLNSGLMVRRNIFGALLHALLHAQIGSQLPRGCRSRRNKGAGALSATVLAFIAFSTKVARSQQRRAVLTPPCGVDGSMLLAGCELHWLGWAAVEVVAQHKHKGLFGSHGFRRLARARRRQAQQRCAAICGDAVPLLFLACHSGDFRRHKFGRLVLP